MTALASLSVFKGLIIVSLAVTGVALVVLLAMFVRDWVTNRLW